MATTINKQRVLTQVLSTARKVADADLAAVGGPEPRLVLEEFIYGLCREDATPAEAGRAFRRLREHFFDWNEVRVSSPREIEEAFAGLPNPEARAQRLVAFLQEVFETEFSYDLEKLHKKGLKLAAKQLSSYQAANDYIGAWVVQRSLGGHALPLDAPTRRCARRLGLIDAGQEDSESARTSLEHLVPKAKGPLFTDGMSWLAEAHCWEGEPQCGSCPLAGDCPTAQEAGIDGLAVVGRRPKPR
jgi:endonuclease III